MRKKNILILIVLILAVMSIIYSFTLSKRNSSTVTTVNIVDTSFKIGTFSPGYNSMVEGLIYDPYNWYYTITKLKDFGLNSSIFYLDTSRFGSIFDGGLYDSVLKYQGYVNRFMEFINDSGVTGNFERGTIMKLCGSQRSTYEAEDNTIYGFYNNVSPVTGHTFTNDPYGVSGRCARVLPSEGQSADNPGYLVSGLIENAEQSDTWYPIGVGGEDDSLWYVKPRMRIDSADAITYQNTSIARVDIVGFWGNVIKSIDIKGENFLNNGNYNSKYIEDYYFPGDYPLTISGNTDTNHLNHAARTDFDSSFNFKSCKVDYRIYWYGVCNLWVDYVRVEDRWAYKLFTPGTFLNPNLYVKKVYEEASAFAVNSKYFHYDEIRKNNLPSIKFVQHIIDSATGGTVKIVPIASSINNELKNKYTNFSLFLDSINPPYLLTDCYPFSFMGEYINVPDRNPYQTWLPPNVTVNKTNLQFLKSNYSTYTNRIQYDRFGDKTSNWDATKSLKHLSLVGHLNRNTVDAKEKGKEHIVAIQAHSYMTEEQNGTCIGINLREPTVEEIRAEVNLSLCYGVKGVYYFMFGGDDPQPPSSANGSGGYACRYLNQGIRKEIGLVYKHPDSTFVVPVRSNYYGQNKFAAIKDINLKINTLGPLLKKLNWQDAFSVHHDGANHNYINDIRSIYRDPAKQFVYTPECLNCDEVKFWEMGFFEKGTGIIGEDYSKYFMMVNRRTTPDISQDGDVRGLYMKFNSSELPDFANWKITDVYTGETYATFDKNSNTTYFFAGEYQPGEGKLLKLAPVMQEGGNLVCNESVNEISFTNENTVLGNGYNITIGGNCDISFKSTGGINMDGGVFTCGNRYITQPVNLHGANCVWNGLLLSNCSSAIIRNTTIQNIYSGGEAFNHAVDIIGCNNIILQGNNFISTNHANFVNVALLENYNTVTSITENTINCGQGGQGISVCSFAGTQTQVYILDNTINSNDGGSGGIYLNSISGGVISNNSINNFAYGITLSFSSVDIYGNTINCSLSNSNPIYSNALSNANLSSVQSLSGTIYTGGSNNISNSNGNNISTENSIFYLDRGHNIFNIPNVNYYHLVGWFPLGDNCSGDGQIPGR